MKLKTGKKKIKRKNLKHNTGKYKYDFQQYEMIKYFSGSICSGKIIIFEADMDRTNLYIKYEKI